MKSLTVHQPWAWAIAAGHKAIENRTWKTDYRGPLLIHAGSSRKSLEAGGRFIERLGLRVPHPDRLTFGAVIARVRLVDCVPFKWVEGQPFAEGPYCWLLEDVEPIGPFPCRGEMGLFNVDLSRLVGIEPPPPAWTTGMLPLH